jgi:nicotinamidase-related amidase
MAEAADTHEDSGATIRGPARGEAGLLIIDMINHLDFAGAERLRPKALAVAGVVAGLRDAADRNGVPVVYVNDNYGRWHSEKSKIVEAFRADDCPGREVVRKIAPRDDDFFVIKPSFSAFYSTNLPVLLPKLGVRRLILTGVAADICVLFTAADAHMRDYKLWAPRDAVASEDDRRADWALDIMRSSMGAETRPTTELTFEQWLAGDQRDRGA